MRWRRCTGVCAKGHMRSASLFRERDRASAYRHRSPLSARFPPVPEPLSPQILSARLTLSFRVIPLQRYNGIASVMIDKPFGCTVGRAGLCVLVWVNVPTSARSLRCCQRDRNNEVYRENGFRDETCVDSHTWVHFHPTYRFSCVMISRSMRRRKLRVSIVDARCGAAESSLRNGSDQIGGHVNATGCTNGRN